MYILFALYNHKKDIFLPLSNISGNPGPLARCCGIRRQKGLTKPIKPTQHRQFLAGIDNGKIRNFVVAQESNSLAKHFDDCLKGLFDFRSLHFTMGNDYVASKAENPLGTGGTDFKQWLQNSQMKPPAIPLTLIMEISMQARIMAHGDAWDWENALDAGKHSCYRLADGKLQVLHISTNTDPLP